MSPILRSAFPVLALTISTSFAGQEISAKTQVTPEVTPFDKGRMELQIGATGYHSFQFSPEVNDIGGVARLGWMLTDVSSDGCFRGNWELLLEAQATGIIDGPGNVIANGALLLRYNFVQPASAWVPYFQLGVGGAYSDMHEDQSQRLIGREWSFHLQGGLGIRYLWSDHCALFAEVMYRHISNADTADRNLGLNSIGAALGVSLFF
jgi:hypothetical protein